MSRPGVPDGSPEVISELRRHLAWVAEEEGEVLWGNRPPPRALPRPSSASPARAPEPTAAAAPRASAATAGQGGPRKLSELPKVERFREEDRRTLDEVRRALGECTRCKLCTARKSIVFGVGNPRAELVFVGEGPGAEEDAQGVPFVGAAGQLLTKMIEAMGLQRDDVYICNVVKCRPPGNRVPELDEIAACEPFLRGQLAAVQPKVLVGLGKTAVQVLLRQELPISQVRGGWREYAGIPLMPTYHPAYLLRSPAAKKDAWEDLKKVMKLLGKEPKRP